MPQLLISAAHKSSGKTTITLGLCAAFKNRRLKVQPFKKGPDYIDPMWLTLASDRPCHNLDFYTSTKQEILHALSHYSKGTDLTLIEGNKGLYDGLDLKGSNSNAALAKLVNAPVVLVLDVRGTIRGVAPLLMGYQLFDSQITIAGVILNQVGGSRHEGKLRAVIEHYTDIPVVGAVHQNRALNLKERHLGLMPSNEDEAANAKIANISRVIAEQVDLNQLMGIAGTATLPLVTADNIHSIPPSVRLRLGIIQDASFGFYYPGDLEALERAGAEIIPINALHDQRLPRIDGLFIGGGFPETHMKALEANHDLRHEIRRAIESGLPTYAECGGLMYLTRSLSWRGQRCAMAGVIQADCAMHERPQGRGYVRLKETSHYPWPQLGSSLSDIAAHEFHYSALENLSSDTRFAYQMQRGQGIDGKHDGIVYNNLLACYAHLRDTKDNPWTNRFIRFAHSCNQHPESTSHR
ncbi:MAG: hydrogenobyrinic acid a,c-diamide synthase (glutamine-hydrolyzing) [Gammaproteobacteria bacterium]|nr:hydrogenobyrinic acid a,c-diamide synthase (glutamine-hydrolyzing) [Gammaproteobacteria bacterium]